MSTPLHFQTLSAASGVLSRREISSVELVEYMLNRIESVDSVLQSFAYVDATRASEAAAALDAERSSGQWRGPLHGVPITVKDIYGEEGLPLEIGMASRVGLKASVTSTVVERLKAAGAIIIGRVHTTEGVYGEHTAPFAPPKNPWGLDRWVGASSSGSGSSTAGGLAFGTIGSDTGGSIRMPSAANGVTGLKPTWGRSSRYGVFELAATLDHPGPMARSARDTGLMLEAIAGFDPKDPTTLPERVDSYGATATTDLSGKTIGVDFEWALSDVSDTVRSSMLRAVDTFQQLGAQIVPVAFPDPEKINDDWFTVCGVQTATAHGAWFDEHSDTYGPALREVIMLGKNASGLDYEEVLRRRNEFKGRVAHLLSRVDALFIPGLPYEAPLAADMLQMGAKELAEVHRYTVPFTMSQMPTITFPIGFTSSEHLPVAGQLVAGALQEKPLVQLANAFQSVTDFNKVHPRIEGAQE